MISAVIVAAGKGRRFGEDKIFYRIFGKSLVQYTLEKFEYLKPIDEIILVVNPESIKRAEEFRSLFSKLKSVVPGGEERGDSVYRGLKEAKGNFVLIHDGARPLVSEALILRVIEALREHPAVVPCIRIRDTVKKMSEEFVEDIIKRDEVVAIQTPQGFRRDFILKAYEKALKEGKYFTDDSTLLEKMLGIKSKRVEGEVTNIKITYREDINFLEAFLMKAESLRIGYGYDRHRLVEGRKLIIGGVEIPHTKGSLGHSDGDALIHAIIDALLGASGKKDIGVLFPDTDEKYRGISSLVLLEKVREMIERDFEIINIDSVILLQEPKIAPYIPSMKKKLAETLKISEDRINIKGKTGEKIGPVGEGKVIEAQAVCLMRKR